MRTNLNNHLFSTITSQLDEVLGLPILPTTLQDELEWYAYEFCQKALFEHYRSQFKYKEKLIDASFAVGTYIRFYCETITDREEKFSKAIDLLENYDIWAGRVDSDSQLTEQAKQMVLSLAEISDETSIKDLITIVIAVFMYGSRVTLRAAN